MELFSKPKVVIWVKSKTVEIFIDKKENNTLSFDINLWEKCTSADLQPLSLYFKQNKVTAVSVLIPDDVVSIKSFIYDTKIDSIDKKEVIGLAESFVTFKIEPEALEYRLIQGEDKTIIQSTIYNKKKIDVLNANLSQLSLKITTLKPVSESISYVISQFYKDEFFLIYPLNKHEYTLMLSKGDMVYLTSNIKGPILDIQKIINYSNLYFKNPTNKIYVPDDKQIEVVSTSKIDSSQYVDGQIAQKFNKASNLPLPVIGLFLTNNLVTTGIISNSNNDINSIKPMENKRNILPLVAVFIFTAALASIAIWFVLNRNSDGIETPASTASNLTPTVEPLPTEAPAPTIAEIDKNIKIQVLNATSISGQAATIKEKLVSLGFKDVTVGNSTETATSNEIRAKATLSSAQAYFQEKLPTFPASFDPTLKETSTYDVVFVIGTDLSKAASKVTPEATKAATPTVEE